MTDTVVVGIAIDPPRDNGVDFDSDRDRAGYSDKKT